MTSPESASVECPDCQKDLMVAMSPMHPMLYIELACDLHRREFQEASGSPAIRDYVPTNKWRR